MAGVFGFPDWLRRGVSISLRAGTAVDSMPLEYLYDPQPGLRARIVPAAGIVSIVCDFGAAVPQGLICLVNSTASGAETVRVRLSSADSTGAAGDVSNTLHATTNADRTRGAVVCLLPADLSARYMRIDIADIAGLVFDIGSLMAMQTVRPGNGMAFGAMEGRRSLGVADRNNFTGAEFRVAGIAQPRYADFSLPSLTSAEYAGAVRDMIADVTAADDVAWVPDDALAQSELNLRTVIGGIKTPGDDLGITRDRPMRGTARFRIVERL
jgi:hypothetical protein